MLTEGWRLGSQQVDFQHGSPESTEAAPVTITVASSPLYDVTLRLTLAELQALLAAGQRLADAIPRPAPRVVETKAKRHPATGRDAGGKKMAKRQIIVSDLSGVEVTEEEGARVRVSYNGSDTFRELDITKKEADELLAGGRTYNKRGRKPSGNGATPAAAPEAEAAGKK